MHIKLFNLLVDSRFSHLSPLFIWVKDSYYFTIYSFNVVRFYEKQHKII